MKGKIVISQMFAGMEFYIVNCRDDPSKTDLELMIYQHGGTLVQNLMPSTTHIVAAVEDFKCRSIRDSFDMNIISNKWVVACVRRGCLLDLEPRFMIYTNAELK